MRRIRILEEAATEAVEAAAWYESERPGLGLEFSAAINAALDLLEDDIVPLATMPGEAGARGAKRLILKRFPYDKHSPRSLVQNSPLALIDFLRNSRGGGKAA